MTNSCLILEVYSHQYLSKMAINRYRLLPVFDVQERQAFGGQPCADPPCRIYQPHALQAFKGS
jgi:hypothetical protein